MKDAEESDTHFYEISHNVKELNKSSVVHEEKDSFNPDIIDSKKEPEVSRRDDIVVPDTKNSEFVVRDVGEIHNTNEIEIQNQENNEEDCKHHDMVDSGYSMLPEADHMKGVSREQCSHSDAIRLGKAVKVNRVSPFRYGDIDSGNLLIDLTESEIEEYKRLQLHSEKNISLKSKEEDDIASCNDYSDDLNISQERFSTDLPRHNWLVKRLKQQNQLNEGDIVSLHASVNDGSEIKKEGKKTEVRTSGTENVSQVMITSPSSPRKGYDVTSKSSFDTVTSTNTHDSIRPLSPLAVNRLSPKKVDPNSDTNSPTKDTPQDSSFPSPKSYTTNSGSTTPRSPYVTNYMSSTLSSSCSSPTKNVSVVGLKPKLVMSTTQQPVTSPKDYPSTLPGIDLSTLKYDSLSRFNSPPKQPVQSHYYPTVSAAYSLPQYGEGRSIREVSRPVPLHLKESYKSEQDAFGLNHRVRLSYTPLSSSKDKATYQNPGIDKSTPMLKGYDAYPSATPASPEEMKRTVAIQRQLENQKRWIAEHEPYKLGAPNNIGKYGERGEGHSNQPATSPLNPTNIPPSRYPPRAAEESYNLDHLSILQSREHLREKIDACNKEIKNIQQQKDVLFARQQGIPNNDSPTHLRIIALNRKLSSLEDYRMKQSALLMKLEAQPFDQLALAREHRSQVPMRKPSYTDINGGVSDSDEMQQKRMNFPDQSENLLLRQLQSKHDEGVSMVTTDSYCRTIDLSKTSEMFYNEMRMENMPNNQPSTPMSNPALKDYPHSGDIPPLVSAERLSANGLPQEKPSVTSGDYPRGHSLTYSKSPDIPRPISLTHSRLPDNHSSHELALSIQRDISMSRDQSRYSQYERIARARELQHSLQVQDVARAPSHDITQIQDRLNIRSRSLNPQELSNGRPETNPSEMSKTRDIPYPHLPGSTNDPTQNPYSPVSVPHSQPYPDASYDDVRSKDIALKRHSNDPARPGQLKLARTIPSMMHQIHASQMDRKYPKVLQHNSVDSKYSPSNMPSMLGEESPYKRTTRYDMVPSSQTAQMNEYESGGGRTSYPSEKQKLRIRTCNACDKESQFLCSGCRGIWYCSRECQLDDWKLHSKNCRKK